MDAKEKLLVEFLGMKQQLVIPVYQRTYSWTTKECNRLWEDINKIPEKTEHFIGSIVSIKRTIDEANEIPQHIIIDGQQRITTILILISVLISKLLNSGKKERAEELKENYLVNRHGKEELKYKMLLTQQDKESLISIIENRNNVELTSKRIKENFNFFKEKIKTEDIEKINIGVRRLLVVDIVIYDGRDNPQLIFESLNSTGLALSQADLIRNYVLMGLEPNFQEKIYKNYWRVMEKNFGQTNYKDFFNKFMRDYLTVKTNIIPNIFQVYEIFKDYYQAEGGKDKTEKIISDVHRFSNYFMKISLGKEEHPKLKKIFTNLKELKVEVASPFLLHVYNDYENELVKENEFVEILELLESYIFRRSICDIPTNSLNKTFASLHKSIELENYLESLKITFIKMDNYRRFPNNDEFSKALKERNLYKYKNCNFYLNKLENYKRKEKVNIAEYTIEHILPQNDNLSSEWQKMLGEKWKEIQVNYLHTLGNLTLTGYNSNLSDKLFFEKKTMKGGFNDSPLRLNSSVRDFDAWNENSIKERAKILSLEMLEIWQYPNVAKEILEKYESNFSKKETIYTLNNYPSLSRSPLKEVFEVFSERVKRLDYSVKEVFNKNYISYKIDSSFVDILPQSENLKLYLNIEYDEIQDPKDLCSDISNKGHLGSGNTTANINSLEQIEDILFLVKQVFDKNLED